MRLEFIEHGRIRLTFEGAEDGWRALTTGAAMNGAAVEINGATWHVTSVVETLGRTHGFEVQVELAPINAWPATSFHIGTAEDVDRWSHVPKAGPITLAQLRGLRTEET